MVGMIKKESVTASGGIPKKAGKTQGLIYYNYR